MRRPLETPFFSQSALLWLGAVVVLCVAVIVADQRQWLVWPRNVASGVLVPVQQRLATATRDGVRAITQRGEVGRLQAENEELRSMVDALRLELVRMHAAELENQQLREQLRYVEVHRQFTLVPAEVIGQDRSNLLGSTVVDQGQAAGVEVGMVVMAPAGLVGRVIAVADHSATILPITQPTSAVNAKVLGSAGATGIANGTANGRLVLRYLPQHEAIEVGDTVVTSGLGGTFPRDVAIGRVTFVRSRDVEMFQEAEVEPLVAIVGLERVLIVTNFYPPDQEQRTEEPPK